MTPKLLDIFSKKHERIKKQVPKPRILIDYREKNSLVASELIKLGFEIEFRELKVADYIVKGVAIERKTVNDFISSMINRRLIGQLEALQQYNDKLLIIEGIDEQELYNDHEINGMNPNSIRGFLLSILFKYKVPILFTKDSGDTAKFIAVISKKKERDPPLNVMRKSFDKKEQLQFIIEGFPGIGPINAKKLLKKFRTIQSILNVPQEELQKTIGKKAEIFKLVKEKYQ